MEVSTDESGVGLKVNRIRRVRQGFHQMAKRPFPLPLDDEVDPRKSTEEAFTKVSGATGPTDHNSQGRGPLFDCLNEVKRTRQLTKAYGEPNKRVPAPIR